MPRSAPSVSWATCQPAFSAPTSMDSSRIATSSRNISQKCDSPVAWRMGRTSMPGGRMSMRKYEMPRRLGAVGSVRASSRHQSAWDAPLAHTFWPVHHDTPPSTGRGARLQAGQVRAGLRLGEALAPDLAVEDGGQVARRCSSVPAASSVEAAWWIGHEGQHQAGRVVRGQLLVEHDLLGRRHAAAPRRRPVGHGVARRPGAPGTTPAGRRRTRRRPRRSGRRASRRGCAPGTSRAPRRGTRPARSSPDGGSVEQPGEAVAAEQPAEGLARWPTGPGGGAAAAGCGG